VSGTRRRDWNRLIAEQQSSGKAVRAFCRECEISEHSFYRWRKRLREEEPAVQFALLETKPATLPDASWPLELVLNNGERLRMGEQVNAATLRLVLELVRG
jgi:putative transposase